MRNVYPGTCYRCGLKVKPYDGHFEKIPEQERREYNIPVRWRLQHATCAIIYRGTKKGKE